MKAIRIHQFGEPSVLKLEDVPEPTPGQGQVVVGVHAIGVNPVDTYIRAGRYGPRAFPFTPGSDCAGVVHALGPGAAGLSVGQRVYTGATLSGAYAELALADAAGVHPLSDRLTFEQGAAIGVPYATAYRALVHRARAVAGETVLVHGGSGAVGIAAIQIARSLGLRVCATAGTPAGLELIRSQGAHAAYDHTQPDYTAAMADAGGVDLILEMLANVNLDRDLKLLKKFGRVIVIGNRGRIEIDPRDTMARDADIRGMTLFNVTPAEMRSIHAALAAGFDNGSLNPVVAMEFPLSEASRAHERVMQSGIGGKIVLKP